MKTSKTVFLLLLALLVLSAPTTVFAAKKSKGVYKDVTTKSVDNKSYTAIKDIKRYHGWDGLIRNGKFYPNRYMTKHELYVVLRNLYGSKVPYSVVVACKGEKAKMSTQFVRNVLIALAKNLGVTIKWSGSSYKMKRKDVARQIEIFIKYNSAFVPKTASSGSSKQTEAELLALLKKLLGL